MCLTPTEVVLNFLHIHCLKSIGICIGPVKKSALIDREMGYLTYKQKFKDFFNYFFFSWFGCLVGFFCKFLGFLHLAAKSSPCKGPFF